jgi:hypothetical protein
MKTGLLDVVIILISTAALVWLGVWEQRNRKPA